MPIDITFAGTLREFQREPSQRILETIQQNDSGILCLGCGFGKTFISLWVVSQIRRKTLIVVHKEFLMHQWVERIQEFIPNARIGILRQNQIDVENKDIVVAMLQSLTVRKNEYPTELFDSFGFSVFDECLPGYQYVATKDGPIPIGTLYDLWVARKNLPLAVSYNEKTQTVEYKPITYAWKKYRTILLEITMTGTHYLTCTPCHKVLGPDGYLPARELRVGSRVRCGSGLATVTKISEIQNPDGYVYDISVADNHNFLCDSFDGPVVHNCHHICSRTFSKALWKVATRQALGLSATPNRKDGLTKVLGWFLGPIVTIGSVGNGVGVPTVRYLHAEYREPPVVKYNYRGKVVLANLLTQISLDPVRQRQLVGVLVGLRREGRKILVLSERRRQCEELKELLGAEGIFDVGLYLGGMSQEALAKSNEERIILATYNMAAEGYDCSTLDTLVMATSRSDIEQSVGRILRKPNGNAPLVVDVVDDVEGLRGQYARRKRYYRVKKFVFEDARKDRGIEEEEVIEFLEDDS